MASRRSSNAASKKRRRSGRSAGSAQPIVDASARNDIIGVLVIVLAIALALSLVSTSTAILTSSVRMALTEGFGAGAMLVPIALLLFGITFFITTELPISARSAIGLSLVVLAILALLSISAPGAELDPDTVLREPALSQCGGYVGGGIAWALLKLVGRPVGYVLLVGVIVAGIVVCGFSISDMVSRVRARAEQVHEQHLARREERSQQKAAAEAAAVEAWGAEDAGSTSAKAGKRRGRREAIGQQATLLDENGEAVTTFIGNRQTSVLRRPDDEAATVVLGADDTGDVDMDDASQPLPEEAATRILTGATPGFLARRKGKPEAQAQSDGQAEVEGEISSKRRKTGKGKAKAPAAAARPGDGDEEFQLPPMSMLKTNPNSASGSVSRADLSQVAQKLQSTLEEFGLTSKVTGWTSGPSVTTFKVSMGEGERVSKITNLQDDIALSLAARSVRIFSPIPGTSLVGIEIANPTTEPVLLGDVLPYVTGGPLSVAFGRDSEGNPVTVDLSELPHLLVAGTTGSGKSVFLNAIIMSILMRATPEQVRFIMVDPKHVEFTSYEGLPHLYVPVITDAHKASSALQWAVSEMERRYKLFERHRVRNIAAYNRGIEKGTVRAEEGEPDPEHMPYFVIVIDELSDLMIVAGKEVESSIVRIAQLGRAAGIHLVVATQRPSADVVTGLIKANIDNRVALAVDNGMNSRIILDQNGAERLLGKGDMLYKIRGHRPRRAQSCFQTDAEIESVVAFLKDQVEPDYHDEILTAVAPSQEGGSGSAGGASDDDPLVWEAAQLVVESQLGSTSALQRHLKVGYARAGRIMDMLEQKGIVGPPDGSKPREVLLDADGLEELRAQESEYREVQ